MKKILYRILLVLLGVFVIAQFFRPELTNPKSDPALSVKTYPGVPPEVIAKMESACFDCHSNETRWPWYSYITPVNYLTVSDVNQGRRHVNFSEWNNYSTGRLKSVLDNIYDQVYNHEMPLKKYQWMHPASRMTDAELKMICDWASGEEDRLDQVSDMQREKNGEEKTDRDATGKKK
ncbi:MAG TPA: heme-binding domain-containing protein [Bacteroidota bacterium]|nr:heme-binding domain-containing protein [Bacteroidota bacterium]